MIRIAFVLLALGFAAPAAAQSEADAAGVRDVIQSQIEAFQADDWTRAFSFASPAIQGLFHNEESFSQMVVTGYPMVWRPKSFNLGALANTPQGLRQTVIFEDSEGRYFVADYTMKRIDGAWRIDGVTIRPAPERGV